MKRGRDNDEGNEDTREPPAKRRPLPHALSITSPDAKAVRETYLTDGEIVAMGGDEPHRVFPVNRLVVGGWSETFRVMINGNFAEGAAARIELPYTAAAVACVVQHMYFLANFADAPVVAPDVAFEVLQLAHMHDQRDLFERAETALWSSNLFNDAAPGDAATLRILLSMGVDLMRLGRYYWKSGVTFPPFSIDVNDEVFKPFLTKLFAHPIRQRDCLMASEYTDELRINSAYDVMSPEEWEEFTANVTERARSGREDPRIVARNMRYMADVARYSAATRCGVRSDQEIAAQIYADGDKYSGSNDTLEDENLGFAVTQSAFHRANDIYHILMRNIYPLPGMPGYGAG